MRQMPAAMVDLWLAGGPFAGADGQANFYVTIEPTWYLTEDNTITPVDERPWRWYQRGDNSQVEVVVPNVKTIQIDRSIDQDCGTCSIEMVNQLLDPNMSGQGARLGDPGHYTPGRASPSSTARFGYVANTWQNYLTEGMLLRTYEGYGGRGKPLVQAIGDGNVVITGVWIIDEVGINPKNGRLSITCRDVAGALLVDQQMFPPIVPAGKYPLRYCRFEYVTNSHPAVPEYDSTDPQFVGAGGFPKFVTDIAMTPDGLGYWVLGNDGGVFSFGNAPFWGSHGSTVLDSHVVGIHPTHDAGGYWMVEKDGTVHVFGNAVHYGEGAGANDVVAIRPTPSGLGYWITTNDGGVFTYGDATFAGSLPVTPTNIVDMIPTVSGLGYWLLNESGHVYAYGDAVHFGNASFSGGEVGRGLAANPDEDGYWITGSNGTISAHGAAELAIANGEFAPYVGEELSDPIFAISPTPSGLGYVLVGGDGGVFTFGDAGFWGSLPAAWTYQTRIDGNYLDYADIVKDILLWCGFYLYGAGGVHGNIENTGTYSPECLDPSMFDKRPCIDPITNIKETVGYLFYVDGEGGVHFETPNWWDPGNNWQDGLPTATIYELGDETNLIDWQPRRKLAPMRSELIVSSDDPRAGFATTITTRFTPDDVELLHGMHRVAMWVNAGFSSAAEQQIMAELIAMHIFFARFQGSARVPGFPGIGINDQVWLYERVTGEAYIHFIRGVSSSNDWDTGVYSMNLTTHRLGTPDNWAVTA